ncbi:hypothetical protein SAMN05446037_1001378 [Anaerovirgula multivorans]|uniref:WYL domain-containing protein n=1 Tax=Anaerovirgula multivorans TaxID=312168 RepID=A0A239A6M9_9FIRM|nr:hypothetical protein [Anaerovirgula multivorans]SNR91277.1 hypothetical protein SAMN05446037_1001378 [Anaerovirgula multivorans]
MIDYVLRYSYKNKKPITLIYQKQLEVSQRRIKVIQLGDKMVQGYCYEKKAIRNFKTDHILAAFIPGLINTTYGKGDCNRPV